MWKGLAATLRGRLVVLEPLEPGHESKLYEAARDMDWTWMSLDAARTPGAFHAYFAAALENMRTGVEVAFATLDADRGEPIGSTRYLALRPEHRRLEVGWTWLRRSRWSTGAHVEVKLLLQLERAFERHGCMRVEFKTDARNERSRAALDALPARFEGIVRTHMLVGDDRTRLRDSAYYAITDGEWLAGKANLERRLGR